MTKWSDKIMCVSRAYNQSDQIIASFRWIFTLGRVYIYINVIMYNEVQHKSTNLLLNKLLNTRIFVNR